MSTKRKKAFQFGLHNYKKRRKNDKMTSRKKENNRARENAAKVAKILGKWGVKCI